MCRAEGRSRMRWDWAEREHIQSDSSQSLLDTRPLQHPPLMPAHARPCLLDAAASLACRCTYRAQETPNHDRCALKIMMGPCPVPSLFFAPRACRRCAAMVLARHSAAWLHAARVLSARCTSHRVCTLSFTSRHPACSTLRGREMSSGKQRSQQPCLQVAAGRGVPATLEIRMQDWQI